ncbi:MAG: hypothetical protein CM15mP111_2170 [Hyphomicrobiales bacterium]|nr:MAG: hypothetical protein CM15mP111_2170 [Hyphomicrobiales bacterium]
MLARRKRLEKKPTAFLTIQEGCDKFCTFALCRTQEAQKYSRTTAELIEEAKSLVDQGVVELTLLGQNVNAYHGESLTNGPFKLGSLNL